MLYVGDSEQYSCRAVQDSEEEQAALNSISSKYLQNDAANKKLQIYENLYGHVS